MGNGDPGGSVVEPLIIRIKCRNGYVDYTELANRPVTATGLDHHRCHWLQRKSFSIKLNMALTFKDEVNFRHLLVVVGATVLGYIDHV